MNIRLLEKDEHEPFVIGHVKAPDGLTETQAMSLIQEAWPEFMETEADCDSDFVFFLSERYNFIPIEDEFQDVIVNPRG